MTLPSVNPYNPPKNPRVWGKFSIREPKDQKVNYRVLHIVDETDFEAFAVCAFWNTVSLGYDQDDLWWRAECLVSYFNMPPLVDTGGIT